MDEIDRQGGLHHPIAGPIVSRFLLRSCGGLIARLDAQGTILDASDRLSSRMPEGDLVSMAGLLSEAGARRWRALLQTLRSGGPPRTIRLKFRGEGPVVLLSCLVHRAEDGTIWLLGMPAVDADVVGASRELARELALLKRHLARSDRMFRLVEKARREARTDPLTGLANRRQGLRWLRKAVATRNRGDVETDLCCVVLDIDDFKAINDTFGHQAGDRVLQAAAQLLRNQLRPDDRIFRFGGEEFVVLLPETGLDDGRAIANRLRVALGERQIRPLNAPVTASFGVACLRAGESSSSLFRRADYAQVRAKQGGRDRVEVDFTP